MLNDSQRTSLCIAMRLIEDRMREIEWLLDHPDQYRLMSEVRNDMSGEMVRALREKIPGVYALIMTLRDRFALPSEIKQASREASKGLSQFWVMLQESNAKALRRYGEVDPALAPRLDPEIASLANLMLELQSVLFGGLAGSDSKSKNRRAH